MRARPLDQRVARTFTQKSLGRDIRPDELEQVTCFRCDDPGRELFTVSPFAARKCASCGLVFISPRLNEAGRTAIYDAPAYFQGKVYSDDGQASESGMATFLQRTWIAGRLDLLARHGVTNGTMVEVGCAYGMFAESAIERGFKVSAVEFSADGAEQTQARLGIDVHHGELLTSPHAPGSQDVVVGWDVVEHVPNPAEFLARAFEVLAPGGALCLSCPYVTSVPARVMRGGWWTLRPDEHLWHFSPKTMTAAMHDAGFTDVDVVVNPLTKSNVGRFDSMVVFARKP